MVTSVASQAAIAIDNAKLFEDLKQANEENERLLELATELDIKKNEFISMASHELKTPLTSIKGYIQLLETLLKKRDDEAYKYVVKTENSINRLQELIEDLLDVSKIESGRLQFNMYDFKFADALTEAIEEIQHTTSTHRLIIERETYAIINGDKNRIIQVLINLLSNAIKYSPDADKIEMQIKETEKEIIVSIKDFGIGIASEHHSKIFERFNRVSDAPHFTGLGIGLYISHEIVKRHQGNIWVESEPGKGSIFYFTLPVADLPNGDKMSILV